MAAYFLSGFSGSMYKSPLTSQPVLIKTLDVRAELWQIFFQYLEKELHDVSIHKFWDYQLAIPLYFYIWPTWPYMFFGYLWTLLKNIFIQGRSRKPSWYQAQKIMSMIPVKVCNICAAYYDYYVLGTI